MKIKVLCLCILLSSLSFNLVFAESKPCPESTPKVLNEFLETSSDGKTLDIQIYEFKEQEVVYMEAESDIYHRDSCRYYTEKSGGDYSRPLWLSDAVTSGIRCSLCIDDELYYTYKEAVHLAEIDSLSRSNVLNNLAIKILAIMNYIMLALFIIFAIRSCVCKKTP